MKNDQRGGRIEGVLDELRQRIKERYPEARFRVAAGPEDPQEVHLVVTVDLDDPDEVLDVVMERMLQSNWTRSCRSMSVRAGHLSGERPCGLHNGSERHSCLRLALFKRPRSGGRERLL